MAENNLGETVLPDHIEDMDPEILAISRVFGALKDLNAESQSRVVAYVSQKLGIVPSLQPVAQVPESPRSAVPHSTEDAEPPQSTRHDDESDELGISPAGVKWAKRNGLSGDELSQIFSLGIDEIDLVSQKVPGDNKKDRLRSVFLLKGIAAYLSTGVAKFTHDDAKETCTHYDAWDPPNFSRSLASIASEVAGSKDVGYTLTTRGLTAGADVVKDLVKAK